MVTDVNIGENPDNNKLKDRKKAAFLTEGSPSSSSLLGNGI